MKDNKIISMLIDLAREQQEWYENARSCESEKIERI